MKRKFKSRACLAGLWLVTAAITALATPVLALPVAASPTVEPLSPAGLFARKCGLCHAPGGTGAFMLGRRLGAERAVLAERRDLTAPFVTAVVRQGLANMPRLSRVEVTDEELSTLATGLARPREEQQP